jgi:hypothetical protein
MIGIYLIGSFMRTGMSASFQLDHLNIPARDPEG